MKAVYLHDGQFPVGTIVSFNILEADFFNPSKLVCVKTENGKTALDRMELLAAYAGETPDDFVILEELTWQIQRYKKFLLFKETENKSCNFYVLGGEIKPERLCREFTRRWP